MIIAIAQISSVIGNVSANKAKHLHAIKLAAVHSANAIFFPELSLTGYHREIAMQYSKPIADWSLAEFTNLSNLHNITIGIGLPVGNIDSSTISMAIIEPYRPLLVYSKKYLFEDEKIFFTKGHKQIYIKVSNSTIVPAICYESILPEFYNQLKGKDHDIYLASAARSESSIENSYRFYSKLAKESNKTVIVVNAVGNGDNFISAGQSAVWERNGQCMAKLGDQEEAVLLYDTENSKSLVMPIHVDL